MTEAKSEYVIVKREPTRDMHANGRGWSDRGNTWSAMISASPSPETVLTEDERTEAIFKGIKEAHANRGFVEHCVARAVESAILKKLGAA